MPRLLVLPLVFALILASIPPSLLSTAAAAQEPEFPDGYVGTWEGTGIQTDADGNPDGEWTITLTITGGPVGAVAGTVNYPDLGCSGELTYLGPDHPTHGQGIRLSEDITVGEGICVDGGTFLLSSGSSSSLYFYWESPDEQTTATGDLPQIGTTGSDETGSGHVMIWTMTCPDVSSTETTIDVTPQLINVDPGPTCYGVESPLTFTITDTDGNATEYTDTPEEALEFDLPFGTYTITENNSGGTETFELAPREDEPEHYCDGHPGCALIIVGVPEGEQASVESFEVPDLYLGTWEGTGTQTNPESDWPITISLTGGVYGEVVGTVDYPTLGCGGDLILNRVDFDDFFLDISEDITYGEDNCIDDGLFTTEAPSSDANDAMDFQWSTPNGSSRASGQVTRVSGQGPTTDWQQTSWEGLTISYPSGNTFSEEDASIGPPVRAFASIQPDDCDPGGDCPILTFRLIPNEEGLSAKEWVNHGLIARNFRDVTIAGQPGVAFETGDPNEYPGESSSFIGVVGTEILEISGIGYEQEVIEQIVASITVSSTSGATFAPLSLTAPYSSCFTLPTRNPEPAEGESPTLASGFAVASAECDPVNGTLTSRTFAMGGTDEPAEGPLQEASDETTMVIEYVPEFTGTLHLEANLTVSGRANASSGSGVAASISPVEEAAGSLLDRLAPRPIAWIANLYEMLSGINVSRGEADAFLRITEGASGETSVELFDVGSSFPLSYWWQNEELDQAPITLSLDVQVTSGQSIRIEVGTSTRVRVWGWASATINLNPSGQVIAVNEVRLTAP